MLDFIAQHAGLIGLIFFFCFFCALVVWVCRPGSTKQFKGYSEIPLKENGDDK